MPGETLLSAHGRRPAADIAGLVIVTHGGTGESTLPTSALQGSVLRMIPGGDELARPSVHRLPIRRTASTAPGISGRSLA